MSSRRVLLAGESSWAQKHGHDQKCPLDLDEDLDKHRAASVKRLLTYLTCCVSWLWAAWSVALWVVWWKPELSPRRFLSSSSCPQAACDQGYTCAWCHSSFLWWAERLMIKGQRRKHSSRELSWRRTRRIFKNRLWITWSFSALRLCVWSRRLAAERPER